jgi:hypothetical protein
MEAQSTPRSKALKSERNQEKASSKKSFKKQYVHSVKDMSFLDRE